MKLLSHDPTWRNLTALDFHYHTQPLPTVLAWYTDKLPQRISACVDVYGAGIELGVPFLIFMPRRIRHFGAWLLIGLQMLILLTGNYTFFNLLTIALCLFLFDDQALGRFAPARGCGRRNPGAARRACRAAFVAALAAVIVLLGSDADD